MRGFTLFAIAACSVVCLTAADDAKSLLRANTAEQEEANPFSSIGKRARKLKRVVSHEVDNIAKHVGDKAAAALHDAAKLEGVAEAEMGDALAFVKNVIKSAGNLGDILEDVVEKGLPSPATVNKEAKKALDMFCTVSSCLVATDAESCGAVPPFDSIKEQIDGESTKGMSNKAKRWAEQAAFEAAMTVLSKGLEMVKEKLTKNKKGKMAAELLKKLNGPCQIVSPANAVSTKLYGSECIFKEFGNAVALLKDFVLAIKDGKLEKAMDLADPSVNKKFPSFGTDRMVECIMNKPVRDTCGKALSYY